MAQTIKKVFALTDGAVGLRLLWHSGICLPDFEETPIVAARRIDDGFEWATAGIICPQCQQYFPIVSGQHGDKCHSTNEVGEQLLTDDAVPLLMFVGNVSIDTSIPLVATCPNCGFASPVSVDACERELVVHIDDKWIAIKCPGGETVYFLSDGVVLASEKQLKGTPAAEAHEFLALPQRIGASKEAVDWLCWVLGIQAADRPDGDFVDVLDLALRYRFKGYGKSFLTEARAYVLHAGSRLEALNGLFTLPRSFADRNALHKLLEGSGLPCKPSVVKAAARHPAALALISKASLGGLCGNDPNLAVTLLESERVDTAWLGSLLNRKGQLSRFVTLAANEEKPAYLMRRLLDMDPKTLSRSVLGFEALKLDSFGELKAYRLARKDYSLTEIIKRPGLLMAYSKSTESVPIRYGDNSALQGEFSGFSFKLPRQTSKFASAGAALKNCLGDGYDMRAALGETLVFLVSKERRLVAAIEVSPESKTVCQMYAKANRRISPTEDLGMAIAQWAHDKGICVRGCDFA